MTEEHQSMFKSILPSVLASCIVALIMGGTTFIGTLSRMNTMFEVIERRIGILEAETREDGKVKKEMEIKFARAEVLLKHLVQRVDEFRADLKENKRKPKKEEMED